MDEVENITKVEYLTALARKRKGVSKGTSNNHGVPRSTLSLNRLQGQPARYAAPSWGKFAHNSPMSSHSRKHFGCNYLRVPQWKGGGDNVMNVIDCEGGGAKKAYEQVQLFGHQRKPTFQFDLNTPCIEEGSKSGTEKPNGGNMIMPPKIEDEEEEEDIASGFWAECPLLPFDEKFNSLPNPKMREFLHLHFMNNNNTPKKARLQNPSPCISQCNPTSSEPHGLVGIGSGLGTNHSSVGNIVYDSPIKGLVNEGNLLVRPAGGPGRARNGSSLPDGSAEFTFVHA